MDRNTKDAQILDHCKSQHQRLAARLAQVGFIWGGSIQSQRTTCGKPGCACSQDPQARHGPYVYWTSKKKGRTVARLLHPPEAEILAEWVANRREMDRIVQEMKELSQKAYKVMLRVRLREMKQ